MTDEERFWSLVGKDCWAWLGTTRWDGYGRLTFRGKQTTANRAAWELANGREIPPGMVILHTCDNPACVNPAHLMLGTQEQNTADRVRKRHTTWGERNHSAKLTTDQVETIKVEARQGRNGNIGELATRYGVCRGTINAILAGKSWVPGGRSKIVPLDRTVPSNG